MSNIWELFTNPNEGNKEIVDKYDRVPNALNFNQILKPVVSEFLFNKGFMPEYPGKKKFAVVISHDIDSLSNDELELANTRHIGGIKSALNVFKNEIINSIKLKSLNQRKDYIPKGMRDILELEEKYKIPASYYFLALTKGEQDFSYNVNEIQHVFKRVKEVGGEIGLHGGHKAYLSGPKMAEERKRLEEACKSKIVGYRNHYLRFDRSITWQALSQNDFLYDSTYADAYTPGFRNGLCYPFMPYDLNRKSFIDIIEVPLIYMDESPSKYMLLNEDCSWKLFCNLVDKVVSLNGVFTLLWHNTSLDDKRRKFYFKAIDYLRKLDPWFVTGSQVAEYYKERKYIDRINELLLEEKP